jgi:hypothetical protein
MKLMELMISGTIGNGNAVRRKTRMATEAWNIV